MRLSKFSLLFVSTLSLGLFNPELIHSQTTSSPVPDQATVQSSVPSPLPAQDGSASTLTWQSKDAKHIFGFPDIKANKKGALVLSTDSLTFTDKSANTSIERNLITAVSAGNERVELWGFTGRILKSAIPYNGDMVAAAFMHHRIDMLTVEFHDKRGTDHSAVFFLPANEAQRALQSFALTSIPPQKSANPVCQDASTEPKSVLVLRPDWDQAEVPAAYRSLVYEHVIDRLRRTKNAGQIYRDGEDSAHPSGCPQYTVRMAIKTFKEGSSVKRSMFGSLGYFVGTTQVKFDVTMSDASGRINNREEIKATIRGQTESTNVADSFAKSIAKRYSKLLKDSANTVTTEKTLEPQK
ncbi:MAG: hypothetical protein JWM43_3012 [Acidobacteriaceae bacterium]|nr:hypothetical protein [Acidobacteriaceae bacterium]